MPPVVATAASQEALMSIKRILVPLPGSASHTGEIEMALSAAKTLGAHVEDVAAGWIALAEQVERIDRHKFPVRDEEK
jgi:hypothetical protein